MVGNLSNFNITNICIYTLNDSRARTSSLSVDEPQGSFVLRMFLVTLVLLAAFLGNIVVIRAVYRYSFGIKPLIYTLVLNVAVGELLNVVLLPFILVYEQTGDWIFGGFLCKIINPLQIMCLTNVTATLAAIAVNRWRIFTFPCKKMISPLKTKLLIGLFWFIGAMLALPLLWLRDLTRRSDGRMRCSWKSHDYRGVYVIVHNVVCYYIPFLIIFSAYAIVGLNLKRHVNSTKRSKENRASFSLTKQVSPQLTSHQDAHLGVGRFFPQMPQTPSSPNSPTSPFGPNLYGCRESIHLTQACAGNRIVVKAKQEILPMMYIIVFSFIVCYIPYQVFFILHHLGIWQKWRYGMIAAAYFQWLVLLPSALHPLIYGTKSKFFAEAFSRLVSCLRKGCKS